MPHDLSEFSSNTANSNTIDISSRLLLVVAATLSVLIFTASLTGTIISTATKSITSSLGVNNVSWVAQSFLIFSTCLQPAWGKVSDIFGCRPPMLIGIFSLFLFSLLAGFSSNMIMLIIARGLMGVGASASLAMVNIIISEIVPIRERGSYMGFISSANGLGQVLGPLLGGVISESLNWRWTMFINIPLVLFSGIPLYFYVKIKSPVGPLSQKFNSLDIKGIILLVLSITSFLLALNFGLKDSWSNSKTYFFMTFAFVLALSFLIVELKTRREPIIDLKLFKYNNVSLNLFGATITGFVMYVGIFFIPEFFAAVYNVSLTSAGVKTWPWMVCVIISSIGCGAAITKFGLYRPYLWVGSLLLAVGFVLMYSQDHKHNYLQQSFFIAIIGVGIGFRMPSSTISAQAAVTRSELAQTTALLNFFRNMGGIFGLSISKAVQNSVFDSNINKIVQNFPKLESQIREIISGNPSEIYAIDAGFVQDQIIITYINSIRLVFLICTIITIVGCIAVAFIEHIELENEDSTDLDKEDSYINTH
ncbi:hypothetical protein BB561_004312 [Smittium simulii]|uniref:Major facilitator superfamily (MFS) profile domain-containing protein n=1 Tax=Smittium simulii TaxID=133385 RepID=A0A2T9YGZ9_9FUNG|nr:hypothetical protein BB561_004312 [Smittium simulii]